MAEMKGQMFFTGKLNHERYIHQAEQKIIQKILILKSSGTSFREIARVLNENGIPTKRGGKWSKTTVQDIYKREHEKKK